MTHIERLREIGETAKAITDGIDDITIADDDARAVADEVLQEVNRLREAIARETDARIKELARELKELKAAKTPIEEGLRVAHNTIKNALNDYNATRMEDTTTQTG